MGWKLNKTFQVDPSGNGEPAGFLETVVSGNSISDLVVIRQGEKSVVLDFVTIKSISEYFNRI